MKVIFVEWNEILGQEWDREKFQTIKIKKEIFDKN